VASKEMSSNDFDKVKDRIMDTVKDFMAPELINRLSSIVVFRPLSKKVMASIFKKELNTFLAARKIKKSVSLPRYTKKKIETVIDEIYDPQFGARPIGRYLHDNIEPDLIQQILESETA